MIKKITIMCIIILISNLFLKSQDLSQYNNFFISKLPEFKEWLSQSNIGTILVFDTLEVNKEDLLLKLKCFNKARQTLADKSNLDTLNSQVVKQFNKNFGEILFEKIQFLMELQNNELKIKIDCRDAFVFVKYAKDKILIKSMTKMSDFPDGYRIEVKAIKGINNSNTLNSTETIDVIKNKLIKGLKQHFKYAETLFEKYEFNVMNQLDNELSVEINNVTKLIIDESYFEHINIKFKFTSIDSDIKIDYTIRAKYGSGIIWAPKSSDYYDMSPKYQEEIETFSIKLKNQIDNILKNN